MSGSGALRAELDRDLGLTGAVALGVGTMIAAGIFVLSGLAVGTVGAMAIAAFLLAAVAASLTALAYAEFATLYPESGGGYTFVTKVFETEFTYVVGWAMILGYPASAAFYLASFSEWAHRFLLPALSLSNAVPYWSLGLGVLGALLVVNLLGTQESGIFQVVTTLLKLGLVAVFLYGALSAFDPEVVAESVRRNSGTLADFRSIVLTSGLVFVTFFGFEAIATNAEEIREPEKTVPRAIFISLGTVVVAYVLVVLGVVLAVENPSFLQFLAGKAGLAGPDAASQFVTENGEVAMARVAQYYLGDGGFLVLVVGALVSMVSAANATVLAGSRVKLAMARRGHLPAWFGRLHSRTNTPYAAVLLTVAFIAGFVVLFTVLFGGAASTLGFGTPLGLAALAHFADFMLLSGLVAVNVALVGSRWNEPDRERGFRVPLVPLVPALAVLSNLLLLIGLELDATLLGAGTLSAAAVVGWLAVDTDSPTEPDAERRVERSPGGESPAVLTPVKGRQDHPLVTMGGALAAGTDGTVMPTSVVELPAQTPTSAAWRSLDEQAELLEDVATGVDDRYVDSRVRSSHDFGHAVRNAVEDHEPNVLLLSSRDAVEVCQFGGGRSVFSSLEETFACDVAIFRPGPLGDADSVFVGAADGPHAETAIAAAAAVARATDARLDLYRGIDADASEAALRDAHDDLEARAHGLEDGETRTLVEPTDDVADSFLDRSAESDLVVVGSTDGRTNDVSVSGAVLRNREAATLVVQSGEESVHLPLF